jgi:microcystin-dependent protein
MHWGEGPGLTPRNLGEQVGSAAVSLTINEIPAHSHQLKAANQTGDTNVPQDAVWAQAPQQGKFIKRDTPLYHGTADKQMDPRALSTAGMGAPHNNRQPYLAVNFIIALQGSFPPRS